MQRPLRYIIAIWVPMLVCFSMQARQPFSKEVWLNETNVAVKVNCLVQDNYHYLWLGTDEGLFYYNGRTFFQVKTNTDIPVTAVSVSGDKKIVGFGNGQVGIWDDVTFRMKKLTGVVPSEAISAIQVLADNVWILATVGQGLYLADHGY